MGNWRRTLPLVLGLGLLSGVLFHLGFLGIFFLIPLQFAGKQGRLAQGLASAVSLALIAVILWVLDLWGGLHGWGMPELVSFLTAFLLLAGWLLIDALAVLKWRFL